MSDAIYRASPQYRRAAAKGANPLPLAAGETLELPRPLGPRIRRAALELVILVAFFGAIMWAYAAWHG